ncbi:interferon gamma receptor 1 [Archocentrus centrarchus]|uniref:interferon gamma receptor 1 n=1 Tax=Archocentrus centrarchus TaxID=63155 RepID=UPI0011EA33D4|nr:interferon gamma receptor 1-like [Archocentrus centrarchus]
MSLHDAFTALLLLVGGVSALIVSPPANVNVSCQNVNVSVRWDYSTEESQTVFRGNIHPWNCTFETTAHQYDLSNCIWKQEERYLKIMHVTIAAIRGGNQSKAVSSNTFSFNRIKTVETKCSLDFPSVEIKVDELMGTVGFKNPLYFYKELKQVNTDAATLDFKVSTTQGSFKGSCSKEETCKCDVSFHEGAEKCVTLTGMMFFRIGVEQMEFRKTPKICDHHKPRENFHEIVLGVVLLSIVFLAILVLIACICKVQAWTMESFKSLPKSLRTNEGGQPLVHKNPAGPDISSVHICDPHKSLPVSSGYPNHSEDLQDSSAGSDCKSASCLDMGTQHLDYSEPDMEDVGLISDRNSTDDDSADDSEKTECVSVEEVVSPYDCPHVLRLDMGNGEVATGYTGN